MENKKYCELCDKYYKNVYSFSNHKRLYHGNQKEPKLVPMEPNGTNIGSKIKHSKNDCDNLKCIYCNYTFKWSKSLIRHIKLNRCKVKKKIDKEEVLEKENIKLKKMLEEDQKNIIKIQKDFEQMKKEMNHLNSEINNTTNNNNATMNNNQQTNNVLIQLGKENIIEVMQKSDQIKILSTCYNSLYRLIKEIHCSDKYPQFKNLAITNLSDNYGHRYDDKLECFVKCHKNELIETLIDNRIVDIEDILNANIDEISEEKAKKLILLIEEITEKRGCYKNKKEQIKLLIYNECKIKL